MCDQGYIGRERGRGCGMSGGNIHAFARRGVLRELTQLVELYAADVNEADVHKMTPLHYAAKRGFTDIIKYLIERGAEIEKRNGTGRRR